MAERLHQDGRHFHDGVFSAVRLRVVSYLQGSGSDAGRKHRAFYLKRLISILPLYYAVALLYIIFLGKETLGENLLLAPVELLGLQANFAGLYSVTHNSGTWFVSCILICYLVFPLLQIVLTQCSVRARVLLILFCATALLASPHVVKNMKTASIYATPLFRAMEFTIGAVLCSLKEEIAREKGYRLLASWPAVLLEFAVLAAGVSNAVACEYSVGDYMMYNWLALPVFCLMLVSITGISAPRLQNNRILGYLCEISYAFFFAQFFTWKTTKFLLDAVHCGSNIVKLIGSFCICMIFTVLLHEAAERPCARVLRKKLIK